MRRSLWITLTTAIVVTGIALAIAWATLAPGGPPLASAAFSLAAITPNADGVTDVTRLTYTLRRPATVSVYFLDSANRRYDFRSERPRGAGSASVDFAGVVDGYIRPDEAVSGEVLARVLTDGAYT